MSGRRSIGWLADKWRCKEVVGGKIDIDLTMRRLKGEGNWLFDVLPYRKGECWHDSTTLRRSKPPPRNIAYRDGVGIINSGEVNLWRGRLSAVFLDNETRLRLF